MDGVGIHMVLNGNVHKPLTGNYFNPRAGRRHHQSSTRKARSAARPASRARATGRPRPSIAQVAASAFGADRAGAGSLRGDTDNTPYGGGNWPRARPASAASRMASRSVARPTCSSCAASILQAKPEELDIREGIVFIANSGSDRLSLRSSPASHISRPDTLPPLQADLHGRRRHSCRSPGRSLSFTNGVQASYLDVRSRSPRFVTLLKSLVLMDFGT